MLDKATSLMPSFFTAPAGVNGIGTTTPTATNVAAKNVMISNFLFHFAIGSSCSALKTTLFTPVEVLQKYRMPGMGLAEAATFAYAIKGFTGLWENNLSRLIYTAPRFGATLAVFAAIQQQLRIQRPPSIYDSSTNRVAKKRTRETGKALRTSDDTEITTPSLSQVPPHQLVAAAAAAGSLVALLYVPIDTILYHRNHVRMLKASVATTSTGLHTLPTPPRFSVSLQAVEAACYYGLFLGTFAVLQSYNNSSAQERERRRRKDNDEEEESGKNLVPLLLGIGNTIGACLCARVLSQSFAVPMRGFTMLHQRDMVINSSSSSSSGGGAGGTTAASLLSTSSVSASKDSQQQRPRRVVVTLRGVLRTAASTMSMHDAAKAYRRLLWQSFLASITTIKGIELVLYDRVVDSWHTDHQGSEGNR